MTLEIRVVTLKLGAPERTRTFDKRLRRPLLYPLSYGGGSQSLLTERGATQFYRLALFSILLRFTALKQAQATKLQADSSTGMAAPSFQRRDLRKSASARLDRIRARIFDHSWCALA